MIQTLNIMSDKSKLSIPSLSFFTSRLNKVFGNQAHNKVKIIAKDVPVKSNFTDTDGNHSLNDHNVLG